MIWGRVYRLMIFMQEWQPVQKQKHHKLMQMSLQNISGLFWSRDWISFMCACHRESAE